MYFINIHKSSSSSLIDTYTVIHLRMVDLSIATFSRAGWFPQKKRLVACVARRNWLLLDAQAWNHRFAAPCCTKPGNLSSGVTHEPYWAMSQLSAEISPPRKRSAPTCPWSQFACSQHLARHATSPWSFPQRVSLCCAPVAKHLLRSFDFTTRLHLGPIRTPSPAAPICPAPCQALRCSLARPLSEKGKPGTGFVLRLSPVSGQTLYQQFERSMVDAQRNLFDFWYHKQP